MKNRKVAVNFEPFVPFGIPKDIKDEDRNPKNRLMPFAAADKIFAANIKFLVHRPEKTQRPTYSRRSKKDINESDFVLGFGVLGEDGG